MAGYIIAIEGLDGVGKHTQAQLLKEWLGPKWELRSFPTYDEDSVFAKPCEAYLHGALGNDPNKVNPYACSAFYAIDRYASYVNDWGKLYEKGTNFVMDRYVDSNIICQLSKLGNKREDKYHFMKRVLGYESYMGIPMPDLTIFLDVDPVISAQLMSERYHGDESKKDIHESNIELQKQFRESAHFAASYLKWKTVDCLAKDGTILPISSIHTTIKGLVVEQGMRDHTNQSSSK
jgi:dTMP kinase